MFSVSIFVCLTVWLCMFVGVFSNAIVFSEPLFACPSYHASLSHQVFASACLFDFLRLYVFFLTLSLCLCFWVGVCKTLRLSLYVWLRVFVGVFISLSLYLCVWTAVWLSLPLCMCIWAAVCLSLSLCLCFWTGVCTIPCLSLWFCLSESVCFYVLPSLSVSPSLSLSLSFCVWAGVV